MNSVLIVSDNLSLRQSADSLVYYDCTMITDIHLECLRSPPNPKKYLSTYCRLCNIFNMRI